MTQIAFPPRLPDVRRCIADGDTTSAIWLMVNSFWPWGRWLNADEIAIVRAAGCPDWVFGEHQ